MEKKLPKTKELTLADLEKVTGGLEAGKKINLKKECKKGFADR